jgi:NADP-dependent 3-hydroxy acid dehydrogenase YdfG
MKLEGSRVLVAGATGFLGEHFAAALAGRGARTALAGRDREALSRVGAEIGAPVVLLDYADPASPADAVAAATHDLGGLDAVLIATGAVAFGRAGEIDSAVRPNCSRSTPPARSS